MMNLFALSLIGQISGGEIALPNKDYGFPVYAVSRQHPLISRVEGDTVVIEDEQALFYLKQGLEKAGSGDNQGAMEDYNRAIAIAPYYALAYSQRSILKRKMGDLKGALEDINKAISINDSYSHYYNTRGILHSRLNQRSAALDDYNKAIEIEPNVAQFYSNRGLFYLREKNTKHLGCADLKTAISMGYKKAVEYSSKYCSSALAQENKPVPATRNKDALRYLVDAVCAYKRDRPGLTARAATLNFLVGMTFEPLNGSTDALRYFSPTRRIKGDLYNARIVFVRYSAVTDWIRSSKSKNWANVAIESVAKKCP